MVHYYLAICRWQNRTLIWCNPNIRNDMANLNSITEDDADANSQYITPQAFAWISGI